MIDPNLDPDKGHPPKQPSERHVFFEAGRERGISQSLKAIVDELAVKARSIATGEYSIRNYLYLLGSFDTRSVAEAGDTPEVSPSDVYKVLEQIPDPKDAQRAAMNILGREGTIEVMKLRGQEFDEDLYLSHGLEELQDHANIGISMSRAAEILALSSSGAVAFDRIIESRQKVSKIFGQRVFEALDQEFGIEGTKIIEHKMGALSSLQKQVVADVFHYFNHIT